MQVAGCAAPLPERVTIPERVTLLPQPDGSPSAVVVQSRTGGATVLDRPYMVATVTEKQIGSEQTGEAAVKLRYKELFDAFPARPRSYLLLFDFGGTRLTPESGNLVQVMLNDLRDLPAPELTIIGHTDAVGTDAFNDELSRQRANSVVELLKAKGIDAKRVSAVGRGSREPLVPAKKGVPEARNRRVEIRLK
jgi:OmpA-OmpF porin, OOP family